MAARRITLQDVADACGFSRITVSKVFNGRGGVPEVTRRTVLETAERLGYRRMQGHTDMPASMRLRSHAVAVISLNLPANDHFGASFFSAFATRLSRAGYSLLMYEVTQDEFRNNQLPAHFAPEQTAGILGIELFHRRYMEMICGLGLPVIFTDTYACPDYASMSADIITMENVSASTHLTERIIAVGAERLGFVGDIEHCNSFYSRWSGFCKALEQAGLPLNRNLCILEPDPSPYGNPAWILERLDAMPSLPDAFICANDFLAVPLMQALRKKNLKIPDDIMIAGFDGSMQSTIVDPPLTTVKIPSREMGYYAAGMLLERIEAPNLPFRFTSVQTTPIWTQTIRGPNGSD